MFQTKVVHKTKIHVSCSITFFPKVVSYCCIAGQAKDDIVERRMRIACSITRATDTHSEYLILHFGGNNGYANAPQCYIICKLLYSDSALSY